MADQKMTLEMVRRLRSMSQAEAAKAVGVSRPTLGRWELDSATAPLGKFAELAELYGWPIEKIWIGSASDYKAKALEDAQNGA